jgi:hypothetical protein
MVSVIVIVQADAIFAGIREVDGFGSRLKLRLGMESEAAKAFDGAAELLGEVETIRPTPRDADLWHLAFNWVRHLSWNLGSADFRGMGVTGLEPVTSSLSSWRSPN